MNEFIVASILLFANSKLHTGMEVTVHGGMHAIALKLLQNLLPFLKENVPEDYKIKVTGHSLGAGVATIFGLQLRMSKRTFEIIFSFTLLFRCKSPSGAVDINFTL